MKKVYLLLLPIAAMTLVGCRGGRGGRGGGSDSTPAGQSTSQGGGGGGGGASTSQGGSGGGGTTGGGAASTSQGGGGGGGSEHSLPWLLDSADVYDESRSGYAGYTDDYDFAGTTVSLENTMVTNNPAGDSHTGSTTQTAFQFCKTGHAKYDPGVLTVSKVKPATVEVKAIVEKSHTWGSNQIGTVTFGGSSVTVPGTSSSVVSDYDANWNIHTVTLTVNASTAGDFVINNTGAFAFYIISLEFKA